MKFGYFDDKAKEYVITTPHCAKLAFAESNWSTAL